MKKESKTKWYSYKELTTSKYGIKWKVYLNKYIKGCRGWKHCKANEFEYLLDSKGNITEVRNVKMLSKIFTV